MRKRIFQCICVVIFLMASIYMSSTVSYADDDDAQETSEEDSNSSTVDTEALIQSINEKQNQLSELEQEKAALQAGRSDIQRIINSLESSRLEAEAYVTQMDQELTAIQANIDSLNAMITEKEEQIEVTTAELEEAERVVEEQYNAMKERIRFMYERGDNMYLEMLMSADSFGDMLNKADYIEQLSEYDRRMLEQYRLVVEYTESVKEELLAEQDLLEEARAAAKSEEDTLNALIDEKEQQIIAFEADISNKEEAIAEYDAELAERAAIMQAIEAAMNAEKEQLAEANRLSYDGGMFTWPAPSYIKITSEYGNRMHPTLGVMKFHDGVDMAAPGGSPILAAYYGSVASTGYTSTMGNYAIIDHGDGLFTIYMHASAIYVSQGEYVSAGQKIGAVGSTGRSTGNHLHFGVRLNGSYVSPWNYL